MRASRFHASSIESPTPRRWHPGHRPTEQPRSRTSFRSSVGDAVRRPAYRDAKARTLAQTAAQVLGPSEPAAGLEVIDDRGRPHRDPAVVLVSDNPYSFEPPRQPGTRPALDSGQLGVVELDPPLRFVIRPLALRVRLHRP